MNKDWKNKKVKIILDCLKDIKGVVIDSIDGYFEKPSALKIKEFNSDKTHWVGISGVIELVQGDLE